MAEVAEPSPCIKPGLAKQSLARGELVRMRTEKLSKTVIKGKNKKRSKKAGNRSTTVTGKGN